MYALTVQLESLHTISLPYCCWHGNAIWMGSKWGTTLYQYWLQSYLIHLSSTSAKCFRYQNNNFNDNSLLWGNDNIKLGVPLFVLHRRLIRRRKQFQTISIENTSTVRTPQCVLRLAQLTNTFWLRALLTSSHYFEKHTASRSSFNFIYCDEFCIKFIIILY
jgi:hypothetical protein